MADPIENIRRPDTTFLWSGELNAQVAAAEAPALSPSAIEETCKNSTDLEEIAHYIQREKKENLPKRDEDVDHSTRVGCVDKLKDLITGPKPKEEHEIDSSVSHIQRGIHRGAIASPSLGAPVLGNRPVGTHDFQRKVEIDGNKLVARPETEGSVHGGFGSGNGGDGHQIGSAKKEGVVSKVLHKLHLGD